MPVKRELDYFSVVLLRLAAQDTLQIIVNSVLGDWFYDNKQLKSAAGCKSNSCKTAKLFWQIFDSIWRATSML